MVLTKGTQDQNLGIKIGKMPSATNVIRWVTLRKHCPNKKQGNVRKDDGSSNSASVKEGDSNSENGDMLSFSAGKLNDC